jgi:hypothetical protein
VLWLAAVEYAGEGYNYFQLHYVLGAFLFKVLLSLQQLKESNKEKPPAYKQRRKTFSKLLLWKTEVLFSVWLRPSSAKATFQLRSSPCFRQTPHFVRQTVSSKQSLIRFFLSSLL